MIALNKMTVGELARVEELSGQRFTSFGDDMSVTTMAALAFVWARREDKKITWKEVQEWDLERVQTALGIEDDEAEEDPLESK